MRIQKNILENQQRNVKLQWNDPRRVLPVPWTETAKKEKIMKQRLIFATGNEHKMKEIREILDESKYEIIL